MKQFRIIFRFEMAAFLKDKVFMGSTIFLVAALAILMFFPRIAGFFKSGGDADAPDAVMLLVPCEGVDEAMLSQVFSGAFPSYQVTAGPLSEDAVRDRVINGGAACAFVLRSPTAYTYYVEDLSLQDANTAIASEALQTVYRMQAMAAAGLTPEQVTEVYATGVTGETVSLGVDQTRNFFYTYVMLMALYMVVMIYGQIVASNVAAEKSSRAMEVLITSARPVAMMFGKLLAAALAGLLQLAAVFGSAILFYRLNRSLWAGNMVMDSMFDIPPGLLLYMLLFFLLGFFLFAFLYGAVGSTVSKLEDVSVVVLPVTMLFVAGFMVAVIAMSTGNMDSLLPRICSYVPLTSPMVMFTRIAMSSVPWWEIVLSVVILVLSVMGVGVVAAKIYRVGVLLYGTPPKPKEILKALKKA